MIRFGRLSKVRREPHTFVCEEFSVVARFGEVGDWGRDTISDHLAFAGSELVKIVAARGGALDDKPERRRFFRVAFLRLRDDGLISEDYCDYAIGEPLSIRQHKAELIAKRARRFLGIERCVISDEELVPSDLVITWRGAYAHLSIRGAWEVIFGKREPKDTSSARHYGVFAPGGTFDIRNGTPVLRDRIKEIEEVLASTLVDSSLLEEYVGNTQPDGIREVRRRVQEARREWTERHKP